ncbi:polysaccharide biosynthesis/export family protein [Mucilaginibacter sp.]|uniref:polysaccharide biosynthesis/export family protein n=1 Tax=Mucilaginibacter sp. TaxID=1882438 RepID=UPI0035BC2FAB
MGYATGVWKHFRFLTCFCALGLYLITTSCINTRKTTYFNDIQNGAFNTPEPAQPIINKNDLLGIYVSSLNAEASLIYNAPSLPTTISAGANGSAMQTVGYLVNEDGVIQFPVLGNIKAAGLTIKELTEVITDSLKTGKLLVDPLVTIRFLNFRVTVLGEVGKPTVITVPNEKISVLEAIGLAGDLTIYGKRDNVLLIREEGGKKIIRRINLNSPAILTSSFYYLKTNDVIYVEPDKNKVASVSNFRQLLPAFIAATTVVIVLLDRLIK